MNSTRSTHATVPKHLKRTETVKSEANSTNLEFWRIVVSGNISLECILRDLICIIAEQPPKFAFVFLSNYEQPSMNYVLLLITIIHAAPTSNRQCRGKSNSQSRRAER